MDTGTGLFSGLVTLGIIYLYTQTKDRWNWILISKLSPLFFILISEIYLVSSGSLLLVNRVNIPNEGLKVDGYDVLKNDGRVIVGRYFDGRMFYYQVFNYSPNGFLGRRNLPFIIQNN